MEPEPSPKACILLGLFCGLSLMSVCFGLVFGGATGLHSSSLNVNRLGTSLNGENHQQASQCT